ARVSADVKTQSIAPATPQIISRQTNTPQAAPKTFGKMSQMMGKRSPFDGYTNNTQPNLAPLSLAHPSLANASLQNLSTLRPTQTLVPPATVVGRSFSADSPQPTANSNITAPINHSIASATATTHHAVQRTRSAASTSTARHAPTFSKTVGNRPIQTIQHSNVSTAPVIQQPHAPQIQSPSTTQLTNFSPNWMPTRSAFSPVVAQRQSARAHEVSTPLTRNSAAAQPTSTINPPIQRLDRGQMATGSPLDAMMLEPLTASADPEDLVASLFDLLDQQEQQQAEAVAPAEIIEHIKQTAPVEERNSAENSYKSSKTAAEVEGPAPEQPDVNALTNAVYRQIRRRLSLEWERGRGY
ncbi:MAG: hypothetical protein ACPG8W_22270, partial [Candidatus Promineifilaceae bacterium]